MTQDQYTEFVLSRFKQLGNLDDITGIPNSGSLIHATIGMMGEYVELAGASSRKNIIEELGDLDFYWTAARSVFILMGARWDFESIPRASMSYEHALISLRNHTGEMLDLAKKMFIYSKAIPPDRFFFSMMQINHRIEDICDTLATTREAVRITNVEKLKLRYPTGYSDQAAQARADKKEGEQ